MTFHSRFPQQSYRQRLLLASRAAFLLCLFTVACLIGSREIAFAQQHEPSQPAAGKPHAAEPEAPPKAHGAQTPAHATEGAAEEPHEEGILPTIAKLFNFGILAGVLVYFLRSPLAGYLQSRATHIRQDLVTAAEMRAAATAQLADIERKLRSLPAELEALMTRGAEDVRAEKARIAQAAAAERERLIDQTRREIQMRLRIARRQLVEHAAELAVRIARDRIARSITPDDQLRMVDRYASQLKEAR
jgi:F-type H+-transporting ATPase subunit b